MAAEKWRESGGKASAGHIQISMPALRASDSVFVQLFKPHRTPSGD